MMSKNLHKVNNARARIVNADHEMVGVDDLTTHPGNPRRGDLAAVKASIEVNGFYGTIVAQRSTGYVLAGNHRLMAARELGMVEVPVVWVDCDDTRARAILAADNRTSELGGFDSEALAQLLEGLRIEDALVGTGYDEAPHPPQEMMGMGVTKLPLRQACAINGALSLGRCGKALPRVGNCA
jgi:hypothetical protein